MLKFLNILPYGYERVTRRDNDDARWNSLAINEPNALNPAYVVMNEKIYKKATYQDDTTAEERAKANAIQAFSDANAANNAVNINYNQLVDLQKQSALKNFIENRNKTETLTSEEQKDKVLLTDQFRKIIEYTKDLQNKGIDLVDSPLNDDIREYYNILSRLKAPTNNPLVGLNKNRDYTNMNIYDNIESMASNSIGVLNSKDIIAMSSVDNIPQKVDKLEKFAKGIKKSMSEENKKFLKELKEIIKNNTGKNIPDKRDPKNEIDEANDIIENNQDDEELNRDIDEFLDSLEERRQEKLNELDKELTDLEDLLSNRQPGNDYTRLEQVYKEKTDEYNKIYSEGENLNPPRTPKPISDVGKYRGTIDENLLDALESYYDELSDEDLTLKRYKFLYAKYNEARDDFITQTGDEDEYPDIRDGHERMLRILKDKSEPEKPPRAEYFNNILDSYPNNSGINALKKLENAYVVPSTSDNAKLAQTFESKDLYSLIVRNTGFPIQTVDYYRKKGTKRLNNTNARTKFFDVINSDQPPENGIRLVELLEDNKLFFDRIGNYYNTNKTENSKKNILFENLVNLGNNMN